MFSPRLLINLSVLTALLATLLFVVLIFFPPYLGFKLAQAPDSQQMVVTRIDPAVETQGLAVGDVVISISAPNGAFLKVEPRYFPPTTFDSQRIYQRDLKAVLQAFAEVYAVISQPRITLELQGKQSVELILDQDRTLATVPGVVWIRFFLGLIAWFLAAIVWSWRPLQKEAVFLLLSGLGLFLSAVPDAVLYHVEMYLLPPMLMQTATFGVVAGVFMHWTFGAALLLYFPQKLKHADLLVKLLVGAVVVYLSVQLFNDLDLSKSLAEQYLYINYGEMDLAIGLLFLTTLILCFAQLKTAGKQPVQRAQALWIVLAWTVGPGIYILLFLLPILIGGEPVLSRTWVNLAFLSTFVMVLAGVGRFQLFHLEQHIGAAYQWVFMTLFFLTLDIVLVSVVNVGPQISTLIIVLLVLWGYVPLRQWMLRRLSNQKQHTYQNLFNDAVVPLVAGSMKVNHNPQLAWDQMLKKVFSPVNIGTSKRRIKTSVQDRGQGLIIAANRYSKATHLEYAEQGNRLFTTDDEELVATLTLLFERLYDFRTAYFAGQSQERERIRRDLHDQIGHKLLSLIYTASDAKSRQLAQDTMEQLRQLIRALKDEFINLDNVIAEVRKLCEESCLNVGLSIHWHDSSGIIGVEKTAAVDLVECKLTSNQYLNILNIVRELLNNTIRHSRASNITVSINQIGDQLKLAFSDNGIGFDPKNITPGNGLFNIESRVKEIDAKIEWRTSIGTQVTLTVPLVEDGALDAESAR